MPEFSIGQRWISAAELQLGLGMVIEIEHRTVSIVFPATTETRIYARQDAPLSRVRFNPGDWVQDHQGELLKVIDLVETAGLIVYACEDESGQPVQLPEGKLNNYLQLNRPAERLLNGQIDRNKWFDLRLQTRNFANTLSQSPIYGLSGCRTSLIAHQLYIAHEVSRRYAPRVLLADEVGLGKTIEAGLVLHQQLLTERANRVLIVVPESLVHQWLVEMLRRFNLMFSVFDEARCTTTRDDDEDEPGEDENPFHGEQLIICSLPFLLDNPLRIEQACDGEWDLLVVDEAHHLAWSAQQASPEYLAIEALAQNTPGVLLLTATPEQLGKEGHFARLKLLDPNRFSDLNSFLREESNYGPLADLVEALQRDDELGAEQLAALVQLLAGSEQQSSLEALGDDEQETRSHARQQLVEHLLDRHGTGRVLFRNTRHTVQGFPERELHAYPLSPMPAGKMPAIPSIDNALAAQRALCPEMALLGAEQESVWSELDARVDWLGQFLLEQGNKKVLVIAASATTALALVEQLKRNNGIRAAVFHEGMGLVERDRAAAYFADHETGSQVLICSEIGSEGRNFQFSHHLVLFDLPINPDLLEQRIGRLDRIGQNAVINIHVPYLQQSAQELMFRWYHEGLNAFEQTCAAGQQVYLQLQQQLFQHLAEPGLPQQVFIDQASELYRQLNEALQQGRDRLLEANSCRPQIAGALTDAALERDYELDIFRFMERLYDCYGVNSEIRGQDCWVLTPGDNMLTKMPGLPEDGMTVTYRRSIALANEDIAYLSWEHPFVRNAMDLILSSEFGNTALIAIKYPAVKPGTLLLDCSFLMEFSDQSKHQNQRYFPNSSVRVVLDEQRRDHSLLLDQDSIESSMQRVDIDTSIKVVKARHGEIGKMLDLAARVAERQVPALVASARARSEEVLGGEIERLSALQKLNAVVRDEELAFFRTRLKQFESALGNARLRLDAVRVMVAV